MTFDVIPGPTWWPAGTVPPRTPLPVVLEPEDDDGFYRERQTRTVWPVPAVAEVVPLPLSAGEVMAYVATRLLALAKTLDDVGEDDYGTDLRYLASSLVADMPADQLGAPA